MSGKDDSVREALAKKGAFGKDIDLDAYEEGDRDADAVRTCRTPSTGGTWRTSGSSPTRWSAPGR